MSMKRVAKEGQIVIAGFVRKVEKKGNMVIVSVPHQPGREAETEWLNVSFTNPREGQNGPKLADFAEKYLKDGQFVAIIANEVQNGQYKNLYAVSCEAPKLA